MVERRTTQGKSSTEGKKVRVPSLRGVCDKTDLYLTSDSSAHSQQQGERWDKKRDAWHTPKCYTDRTTCRCDPVSGRRHNTASHDRQGMLTNQGVTPCLTCACKQVNTGKYYRESCNHPINCRHTQIYAYSNKKQPTPKMPSSCYYQPQTVMDVCS